MFNFTRDQLEDFPFGVPLSFYTDRLQDYQIEPYALLDHRRIVADVQLGGVGFTVVGVIDPNDLMILVELSWHEDAVSFEGVPLEGVDMAELEQVLIEKGMVPVLENDLIKVPSHLLGFYFFEDRVRAISWATPDFES